MGSCTDSIHERIRQLDEVGPWPGADGIAALIKARAVTVIVLVGLLASPAGPAAQEAAPDPDASAALAAPWPMFGRTAQHKGRTPVVGVQDATLAWTTEIDPTGLGASSPIVGFDGTLYVANETGLTALSPAGTTLWHYPAGATASVPALGSHGTIYLGSAVGLVAPSLMARSWTYSSGKTRGPVVAPTDTVYVIGSGPAVYALGPDGTLVWRQPLPGISGTPALGPDGTIYVTGAREECSIDVCFYLALSLDPASGRPRRVRQSRRGTPRCRSLAVTERSTSGRHRGPPGGLYAIGRRGRLKWRYEVGGSSSRPRRIEMGPRTWRRATVVYAIRRRRTGLALRNGRCGRARAGFARNDLLPGRGGRRDHLRRLAGRLRLRPEPRRNSQVAVPAAADPASAPSSRPRRPSAGTGPYTSPAGPATRSRRASFSSHSVPGRESLGGELSLAIVESHRVSTPPTRLRRRRERETSDGRELERLQSGPPGSVKVVDFTWGSV
jgi:hypothetical protein